jgi:NAD(P)-dependent dehydrogenase (short-subunit alcohol dehydrogenase family)
VEVQKTAIVTGGGTGIGLATGTLLAEQGYRVLAGGLDCDETIPKGIEFVRTDVTNEADLQALIGSAERVDAGCGFRRSRPRIPIGSRPPIPI